MLQMQEESTTTDEGGGGGQYVLDALSDNPLQGRLATSKLVHPGRCGERRYPTIVARGIVATLGVIERDSGVVK